MQTKKNRGVRGLPGNRMNSDYSDVRSLRALLTLSDFEFDSLPLTQALETLASDFLEMREEILAALFRRDEAEALAVIEPFHGSGLCRIDGHDVSRKEARAAIADARQRHARNHQGGYPY